MDLHLISSSNGSQLETQSADEFMNEEMSNEPPGLKLTCSDQKLVNGPPIQEQIVDCDFSDGILKYIDHILMEEDMEEKTHMLQESLDFQAKERSFYEVLGENYPPSSLLDSALADRPDDIYSHYNNSYNSTTSSSSEYLNLIDVVDPSCPNTCMDSNDYLLTNVIVSDETCKDSDDPHPVGDMNSEIEAVWYFRKGFDDASKFLPSGSKTFDINVESDHNIENSCYEARGKKNHHHDCQEERSTKISAIYRESNNIPIEEFDDILLYTVGEREKKFESYRMNLLNAGIKIVPQGGKAKRSNVAKARGKKKQNMKRDVVDLRALLTDCVKAISVDDRGTTNEFLKQIREHSSPFGDGNQRLAHYFADGIEARLAGNGSQIFNSLVCKRTTASDYLKAYYTYLASSPFDKVSNFLSNKLIFVKSKGSMRIHIIDFGIMYGFKWPTYIQRLLEREGGPPRLRITGIDFPQPGFRPAERIEETGRRLARYAKKFNVPFEYNAIAQNWETIKLEDLKIEEGEFIAVNCMYRAENLPDETSATESSRTMVLNLIKKINPDIFVHGIVNGAYGGPFFVSRFRGALFHFSALFDMLETNIPREKPERMLLEKDIFGQEALNVIACEGWERVQRPETYKQWRVRCLNAGFMQVPFGRDLTDEAKSKVKNLYHRDFVIDEDNEWLLMGWKGRILYAISCWQPNLFDN